MLLLLLSENNYVGVALYIEQQATKVVEHGIRGEVSWKELASRRRVEI